MAGIPDFQEFYDDFNVTVATLPAAADPATPWLIVDTSAAGTPTYTKGTSVATLKLASNNEVENVCLAFGDSLDFDIDDLQSIEFRLRLDVAMTAGTELCFGVASARNDTTDNIAANAWFKLVGSSAIVVESDDAVRDIDDIATGQTLGTSFRRFFINFATGKGDVEFQVDGIPVARSTTFNMSNYALGLQPFVQLQKAANTNVNGVVIDYVRVVCKR